MSSDNTDFVLIVDSHLVRARECSLILHFAGEKTTIFDESNWQPIANDLQKYKIIFLGEPFERGIAGLNSQQKILLDILSSKNFKVPVITYAESDVTYDDLIAMITMGHLKWPFTHAELMSMLHRCQIARGQRLTKNTITLDNDNYQALIGNSFIMKQVRQLITQVAETEATVLITGESGTGKEVVARQIHLQSKRSSGPFVPINCGAIPADLLESELFGHEKGAFTGAISARQGRFELAKGGTLFLDEIGDMPLNMQVKLLRVLQERRFERVGSSKSIDADVRIITATNKNLDDAIRHEKFREDLYYRINVFPIEIPRLLERMEDLPLLINELITRHKHETDVEIRLLPAAIDTLRAYHWPGNIRELSNLVERLTILYPNGIVDSHDLPDKFKQKAKIIADCSETIAVNELHLDETINLKETINQLELQYIKQALSMCDGVVAHAAEVLQIRRTTLVEKMRKYGLLRSELVTNN